jgi:DNA-binding IclR family transcriptional regulator
MMSKSNTTVDKVLEILLLFNEHHRELSIEEISQVIGTPKSTTYRHIAILQNKGFLERTSPGNFRLGLRILQLARALRSKWDVADIALPIMEAIAEQAQETVLLTRLFARQGIIIERVEPPQTVRISFEAGQVQPLHAGASWKILLANLNEDAWDQYLPQPLTQFTASTITDLGALKGDLRQIRKQGYAVTYNEVDPEVVAVAVPILNTKKQLVAGLSLAGPSFRMDETAIENHLGLLMQGAADIQEVLPGFGRSASDA